MAEISCTGNREMPHVRAPRPNGPSINRRSTALLQRALPPAVDLGAWFEDEQRGVPDEAPAEEWDGTKDTDDVDPPLR